MDEPQQGARTAAGDSGRAPIGGGSPAAVPGAAPAATSPADRALAPSASAGAGAYLTHADYARFARQPLDQIARDCEVSVFRATGPGGQGVNTADSAVRMRHVPTGLVVVSRESRSQYQNRRTCLVKLAALFEQRARPPKKRTKTKVSRSQKERRLKAKHAVGKKKALRSSVRSADE